MTEETAHTPKVNMGPFHLLCYFFFFLAAAHSLQEFNSPIRDQTWALGSESIKP